MPLKLITSGGGSVILDANTTGSNFTVNVPAQGGAMLTTGSLSGINASAMSVGSIPYERFSAGTVVQYQEYIAPSLNDNYTLISADTEYVTPASLAFAPRFANSRLLIHAEAQTRIVNALGVYTRIRKNGVSIGTGANGGGTVSFWYKGDTVNHHYQIFAKTSHLPGSTASATYDMSFIPYAGSGEFNAGWGPPYIRIWEIRQ